MVTANSSMNFVIFLGSANFGSVVVFSERDQQLRSLCNHHPLSTH